MQEQKKLWKFKKRNVACLMKKYIIVVAGGKGLRMGGDIPKQFIPVKGKPVLMRTLEAFLCLR